MGMSLQQLLVRMLLDLGFTPTENPKKFEVLCVRRSGKRLNVWVTQTIEINVPSLPGMPVKHWRFVSREGKPQDVLQRVAKAINELYLL